MKHNEFKAFYTKKIKERYPDLDVVCVDVTIGSRMIYILKDLTPIIYLKTFFGTDDFHIRIFRGELIYEDRGNYTQHSLLTSLQQLDEVIATSV